MSRKKEPLKKECHCGKIFYVKPSLEKVRSCSISCSRKLVKPYERTEKDKKRIGDLNRGKSMSDEIKKKISESKKGTIPWMKGKKHTKEAREKNSQANMGRKVWNKGLIGYRAGELNNRWKGGITPENKKGRTSTEYRAWQKSVFERDNYCCTDCKEQGGYLHADHIEKYSERPELRYDVKNGRTLCRGCHYKLTFNKDMPKDSKWGIRYQQKQQSRLTLSLLVIT
jgi:hypothetical protein